MHYVYVLLSNKDKKFYIGSTADIRRRYKEHCYGKVFATKSRLPMKLIYYEVFSNKTDALKEELFLKTGKGRERLRYLLKNSINL
jgi:putative endonuclease